MNPIGAIAVIGVSILLIGCASHPPAATSNPAAGASATSQPAIDGWPILYHRTGGIAGTDDRVIIWPDGRVEVDGRVMPDAISRIGRERVEHLVTMLAGWNKLRDQYLASNVEDAYLIRIDYRGKAVEATDINPDLPREFTDVYTEIESIAAQAANAPAAP